MRGAAAWPAWPEGGCPTVGPEVTRLVPSVTRHLSEKSQREPGNVQPEVRRPQKELVLCAPPSHSSLNSHIICGEDMPGWRLPPCGVVLAIASFKLLQFCDRSIVSGSPIEFSAFVAQTMGGAREATLFGALSSVYTVGTIAGCLTAPALLLRGCAQHRLLGYSMITWLLGVGCSSIAFWLPPVPSTCMLQRHSTHWAQQPSASASLLPLGELCPCVCLPVHVGPVTSASLSSFPALPCPPGPRHRPHSTRAPDLVQMSFSASRACSPASAAV